MAAKKWLARAGALFILMGFLLPSLTVSCTSAPVTNLSYSLMDLASEKGDLGAPVLYMIPLGALLTLIFAFLPERPNFPKPVLFFGQASGAVVGVLSILLTVLLYSRDYGRYGFDITPEFGGYLLAVGYTLIAAGLVFQLPDLAPMEPPYSEPYSTGAPPQTDQPVIAPRGNQPSIDPHLSAPGARSPSQSAIPPASFADMYVTPAWLRVVQGDLQQMIVPLDKDHFTIGRGSSCHLRLSDRAISRQHVRLRFARGAWYLQDQGSAAGTFVNGERVNATRLEPGDMIKIGDCLFEFHMQ